MSEPKQEVKAQTKAPKEVIEAVLSAFKEEKGAAKSGPHSRELDMAYNKVIESVALVLPEIEHLEAVKFEIEIAKLPKEKRQAARDKAKA
jgi:hypothetical protein